MFRAAIELLFLILIIMVARAILTSVMKGVSNASQKAARGDQPGASASNNQQSQDQRNRGPASQPSGELHKDPVCGTYVAESTAFRRQASGQSFYYCSEVCRGKHTPVTR